MPIRQLDTALINRIAAGEVVERPASVVKELVENALDAGARRIEVMTEGGGRRLIRVGDDGEGMTRDDLVLAVERHATSKLAAGDALLAIRTLGFRGEDLARVARWARPGIPPRHADEPHAWTIAVEAGVKSPARPAALGAGTQVQVRDLFFATPARLKFLKTDRTEAEAIRDVVRRLAMSRPDVGFTLAGEERAPVTWGPTLPGPPGRLARLGDVLGPDFRANATEVRGGREGLMIEGFAGLPTFSRANTLGQYLFVNGRPVRDKLLHGAVRGAYADHLPRDRHPVVALFVTADPRVVAVEAAPDAASPLVDRPLGAARAQVHETYIVAQTRDGVVIVDQHAAHERLVYERMKTALAQSGVARQILLIPDIVELDEADVERLTARSAELARFGLVIESFGPGAVAVRETPGMLGEIDAGALLRDLAEHMAEWDEALPLERRVLHV